jgi:hypothetical protein
MERSNDEGFNPQEPSVLDHSHDTASAFNVTIYDDSQKINTTSNSEGLTHSILSEDVTLEHAIIKSLQISSSSSKEHALSSKQHNIQKRKSNSLRRRRVAGEANIENRRHGKGLILPSNQYDAVLIRRAIRKKESSMSSNEYFQNEILIASDAPDIYGDISLGMKLTVVAGKVIVHHLNALDDGRASPAQLTGVISRGDVLISVNHRSLVNLPLDQLMSCLGPLSTADSTGCYQRKIKLRFAKRIGLDLLMSTEEISSVSNDIKPQDGGLDVARDMLALFPMVDQLSGMPFFEEQVIQTRPMAKNTSVADPGGVSPKDEMNNENIAVPSKKPTAVSDKISKSLASYRSNDRKQILYEFESWKNNFLDSVQQDISGVEDFPHNLIMTKTLPELLEIGRNAVLGANAISKQLEEVDGGKDLRSFRSWNSNLSQYSRASQRRKRIFDGASHFGRVDEDPDENSTMDGVDSTPSLASEIEEEKGDGDELLLRLASHDEIWRRQVLDFLEKASLDVNENESMEVEEDKAQESDDIDAALSKELGNFLFGDNMTKILKKQGRPLSLPPDEVTAVLFDLATKLASSVPDEITSHGDPFTVRSSLVPFSGLKRPPLGSDVHLATRFLLDEAFPKWLKSFRPLPWEFRRLLWPLDGRLNVAGSTAGSSMSDDLTIESLGTGRQTVSTQRRNDIVAMIEDREMNTETMVETYVYFSSSPCLQNHNLHACYSL